MGLIQLLLVIFVGLVIGVEIALIVLFKMRKGIHLEGSKALKAWETYQIGEYIPSCKDSWYSTSLKDYNKNLNRMNYSIVALVWTTILEVILIFAI